MLDYLDTDRCRMRFLRDQLDDPEAATCGRCDNCGGLTLSARRVRRRGRRGRRAAGPARAWSSSRARCGRPRSPTSASTSRARSPTAPSEGRAVARLTDLGYGQALRELFRPGDRPTARCRCRWRGAWSRCSATGARRSTGSSCVESATRPTLTGDLADGLSRYLQVPVAGRFAIVDPDVAPGQGAMNSAQRVAAVGAALRARGRRASPGAGAAGRRPGRHRLDAHPRGPGAARRPGPTEVLPLALGVEA